MAIIAIVGMLLILNTATIASVGLAAYHKKNVGTAWVDYSRSEIARKNFDVLEACMLNFEAMRV